MNRFFLLFVLLVLLVPNIVMAGEGRTAAPILNLGGGARATALGDAFSAMSGDVTSSLWNPSGIAKVPDSIFRSGKKGILASMYYKNQGSIFGEAGEGLYYTFLSAAIPVGDFGTFGTTLQFVGKGTTAVTTNSPTVEREENLGTDMVFTVSYADSIMDSLSIGLSTKMIRLVLAREVGTTYAVDAGIQYMLPFEILPTTIGVAIQNVGPKIHFIDENQADALPTFMRIGTATSLYHGKYNHIRLVTGISAYIDKWREDEEELTAYLENTNMNRTEELTRAQVLSDRGVGFRAFEWRHLEKNIGIEYWLVNILALRIGHKNDLSGLPKPSLSDHFSDGFKFSNVTPFLLDLSDYFTYGIGVKLYNFRLDITYGPQLGPYAKRHLELTGGLVY